MGDPVVAAAAAVATLAIVEEIAVAMAALEVVGVGWGMSTPIVWIENTPPVGCRTAEDRAVNRGPSFANRTAAWAIAMGSVPSFRRSRAGATRCAEGADRLETGLAARRKEKSSK